MAQFSSNLIERQREHFNSIAAHYQAARGGTNYVYLNHLLWGALLKDIDRFRNRPVKVLEPMCGFGDGFFIVKNFLSDQLTYSGYDYSDAVIGMVRQQNPSLNVWQADATKYDPPSSIFDIVIIIGGLHHVFRHAPEIVAKCARALTPSGLFISFEPTYGNRITRSVRERIYRTNSLFDADTERSFAVSELLNMFRSAGLFPYKIAYPGLLSYVLYFNPDAFPSLSIGGTTCVKALFSVDRLIYRGRIGRFFSFATLSIWEKPKTTKPEIG